MPRRSGESSLGSASVSGAGKADKARSEARVEHSFEQNAAGLLEDLQELSLAELTEMLRNEPHKLAPCLLLARRSSLQFNGSGQSEPDFHESVTKLYKVPKDFIRAYLVQLAPQHFTMAKLRDMEKKREGTTRAMCVWAHGVFEKTSMPNRCRNKRVWRASFRRL